MNETASILEQRRLLGPEQSAHLEQAAAVAASWAVIPRPPASNIFAEHVHNVQRRLNLLEKFLASAPVDTAKESPSSFDIVVRELRSDFRLLKSAIASVTGKEQKIARLPRVVVAGKPDKIRLSAAADAYLSAVDGDLSTSSFQAFVRALQVHEPLTLDELWDFGSFIKLSLLESLLDFAPVLERAPESVIAAPFSVRLRSLRTAANADWTTLAEPLITFDSVLSQDPASAYSRMDFESRESYRQRVAFLARRSDSTELQVAQAALDLAREAEAKPSDDIRIQGRRRHVGYYLVDKGLPLLTDRVSFHAPVSWRLRQFVFKHAEDVYITAVYVCTALLIAAALFPVLQRIGQLASLATAIVALLFPTMQVAVELVNNAVTSFLDPVALPKLDFSKGIPSDCTTLVAVPTLLINEKQVAGLVRDLEVRYLANRDPNLHFALVTDLPDSVSKPRDLDAHRLVDLAIRLIHELNEKYRSGNDGAFLLLHRHRIFNTRQGVWMGWERKRGKLLDLNKLLMGGFDAFPIKAGGLEALRDVRYVLTLDSDTQLPRDAAASLVGAIAHPLNQAIIDPKRRIVVEGYGILQPRIGVTVHSMTRSRFAAIYSGQNGFDIYTRAVSDAYQDLLGEGIFTGKGIYEVAALHEVLDRRFPRNELLSHDLIEGAYARAGLVTDIELVDDYPSHFSAYSRRQHRWLRGDWQIAQWMFARVPDEAGHNGPNPISAISRWKIFDNMRRSLVAPFLLTLFIAGWLGLPGGPIYWTVVTLALFVFPVIAERFFAMCRSLARGEGIRLGQLFDGLTARMLIVLLDLVFLAQTTVVAFDAVIRSLIRRFITGERLLEWETAAQSELRTAGGAGIDRYLGVMPFLSALLAVIIWGVTRRFTPLICAAPILLLWAIARPVAAWLDRPLLDRQKLSPTDIDFLLVNALRIWRYFREFGVERHNFLIPDNVEEVALREAPRISPTNIGLLLNARQAACELGFLTTPEFSLLTRHTLATILRMEKYRGHLCNWYDTQTLEPLISSPAGAQFISTVDSGNFVASLFTLVSGAREIPEKPLLPPRLFTGLHAHWHLMRKEGKLPSSIAELRLPAPAASASDWIEWLTSTEVQLSQAIAASTDDPRQRWWLNETHHRVAAVLSLVRDYLPWALPEYKPLLALPRLACDSKASGLSLVDALPFAESLQVTLEERPDEGVAGDVSVPHGAHSMVELRLRLLEHLGKAIRNLQSLRTALRAIAHDSERLAGDMGFSFLVDPDRQILSIGYDTGTQRIHESCYDQLASEARIATFLAVARGELPQQSWFRLGRDHTFSFGRFILLSWTGTMFEYLMPALWMRTYPGTLIFCTQDASVHVQRAFAQTLKLPWGISEAGDSRQDDAGHYQYHAYGVPAVALSDEAIAGPVIAPYATLLALNIDPRESLRNLHRMAKSGWLGDYGFYESADYSVAGQKPALVREWMAHHQGMSLLSIVNLLRDNVVQRWFHEIPLVESSERILHEVCPTKAAVQSQ
jgi:hypothetical protein